MASIVTYSDGLRRIEFSLTPNGKRKAIRLGRMNAKTAETVAAKIEAIIGDRLANRPHDAETSKWLGGLDEKLLARLRATGLAQGVGLSQMTLGAFMEQFFAVLGGKYSTKQTYGHTRRNLETHLGTSRLLRDITAADADAWRSALVEKEKLSPATVARRVVAARTIWRKAIRWNLASVNPFEGVKTGHQSNDSRKVFVSREVIERIIAEAADPEWKAIIALARYGGLRCPSELLALRWGDVDWEHSRIRIPSPKTEHHEGGGSRTIPLFAELLPHLRTLFEAAEPGTEFMIAHYRGGKINLRSQFERIIVRAGLTPWPKLFHNLRASRETELMREYDLATVCRWIGNSPEVAAKHYAMSTDLDADFKRAAGLPAEAQQKAQHFAQQTAAGGDGQAMTKVGEKSEKERENKAFVASSRLSSKADKTDQWAREESNTPAIPCGKPHIADIGAAKSAAFGGDSFAQAVADVMRLPLTDAEKAQAVRRLLAEVSPGQPKGGEQ